jgi:hypothetical protein
MYDDSTIILRDKIYIPALTLDESLVEKKYIHYIYDHKTCARCENKPERHNYICDQCPAFKGRVSTCNRVVKNDVDYVGVPIGDRLIVEKKLGIDLDDYTVVDKRVKAKFRYPVKMVKSFKLRDYQEKAVNEWWEYKHGLIVAPPRSGKTPTMLAMAVELGYRTILLAHQHDFLTQFIDHIEQYTNLPALSEKAGKKLYGFPKKLSDFDDFEICVCTYQQFITENTGVKRFKAASPNFGTLLVDECFVYDTLVVVDFEGRTEKIGDIVEHGVANEVVSYNHESESFELKPIESCTKKEAEELYDVEYEGGSFRCTGNHEFWCVNRNSYVAVKDLSEDDELLLGPREE